MERFNHIKPPMNQNIGYDIPSTKSARAASFGYGMRNTIQGNAWSPSPGHYKQDSDFDKTKPHGKQFSFGISREAYGKVFIKGNSSPEKTNPGPGSYNLDPKFAKEAKKFSIYGKSPNHILLTSSRFNPGPGAYAPKVTISDKGKYPVAGYKNSLAPSFSLPSFKRFQNDETDMKKSPGPAAYAPKVGISDTSSSFIS